MTTTKRVNKKHGWAVIRSSTFSGKPIIEGPAKLVSIVAAGEEEMGVWPRWEVHFPEDDQGHNVTRIVQPSDIYTTEEECETASSRAVRELAQQGGIEV